MHDFAGTITTLGVDLVEDGFLVSGDAEAIEGLEALYDLGDEDGVEELDEGGFRGGSEGFEDDFFGEGAGRFPDGSAMTCLRVLPV